MKQKVVIALIFLGIIALGVVVQGKVSKRLDKLAEVAKEAQAKQAEQGKKPPLQLASPTPGPVTETLHLTGSLKPDAEVALGFKVPGRVVEVSVKRGDVVTAGQALARLDGRDLEAQLAQAEAGRKAAQAQRSVAADAYKRAKALAEAGAASEQQVVAASGQTDAISATIQQAGAAKRYIELVRGETRLVSPIDGVVVQAPTAPGFVVQVMSPPSFVIQRLATLKFNGHLSDKDAARVKAGMPFEVESDAGVVTKGTLDVVIPSVDPMTRRVPIEGSVPNDGGRLFAGSMVEARVEVPSEPSLAIPLAALLTGSRPAVLALGPDRKLVRREVEVLRVDHDKLLIKTGIAATDRVAVSPGVQWREGDAVPPEVR